ncbi:MAG TPA: hypothetical protein ENJ93_06625 [Chloroflexi bacterium]|nr:hypothetical protein [Chloroflexota bacterium]
MRKYALFLVGLLVLIDGADGIATAVYACPRASLGQSEAEVVRSTAVFAGKVTEMRSTGSTVKS